MISEKRSNNFHLTFPHAEQLVAALFISRY